MRKVEVLTNGTVRKVEVSKGGVSVPSEQGVSRAEGVPQTVFWGVFAEGAEPTPPDDGKVHYGFRIAAP